MSLPLQLGLAAFCITLGIRLAVRTDRLLALSASHLKTQPVPPMLGSFLWPLFWFFLFVVGPIAALIISLIAFFTHGPAIWQLYLTGSAAALVAFGLWKMRR